MAILQADDAAVTARLTDLLWKRFVGREDCYLSERRKCVREPLTCEVMARHLRGDERIGSYPDGAPKFLGLDHDGKTPKKVPKGGDAAWREVQAVGAIIDADLGLGPIVAELTRSGIGYRAIVFYDASDLPSFEEHKRFGKLLLRAAGLPDDENETRGSPGVYPHPPGPKLTGTTPYLPLFGILRGEAIAAGRFVELGSGLPLEDQAAALECARAFSRAEILVATQRLEELAPPTAEPPIRPPVAKATFDGNLTNYAEAALRDEAVKVANAGRGDRHHALIAASCALGELVAGGALPDELMESELFVACENNGMIAEGREAEVRRTIADGLARGAEHPRAPEPSPSRRTTRPNAAPGSNGPTSSPSVGVEEPPVDDLEEPEWIREGDERFDTPPIPESPRPEGDNPSRPAPTPESLDLPSSCWRRGFREFRDAWAGSTEAPDAYLWSGYLTAAGLMLGRDAVLSMGMDVFPNIWSVLVGKTGKPRKTTAQNMGARLVRKGDESVIHLPGMVRQRGCSRFSPPSKPRPTRPGRSSRRFALAAAACFSGLRSCQACSGSVDRKQPPISARRSRRCTTARRKCGFRTATARSRRRNRFSPSVPGPRLSGSNVTCMKTTFMVGWRIAS